MRIENCELPWTTTKSFGVRVLRVSEAPSVKFGSPKHALAYWRTVIAKKQWFDSDKEHLVAILLSTNYDVQGHSLVSIGSMNESIAHPREIFRAAVAGGAYAIVLMHNHPSGDPEPSKSDHALTRRLDECGELLQIRLLDHVIVGKGRLYWSFNEHPRPRVSKRQPRAHRIRRVRFSVARSCSRAL